jgi:ribosomal protein L12E/L44/L45/RPP1/RPP2
MTATFSVKNFAQFQHYKDRSPPWIKLYNGLLDDYDFGQLPDAAKLHLVAIWLLASRSDNKVPYDPRWIAKRISATDKVDLDRLRAAGFIALNDDNPLAPCAQPADPEREAEAEAEAEEEEEDSSAAADARPRGSSGKKNYPPAFEDFWRDYPTDPLMSKVKAFEKWGRLGAADRAAAQAALPAFRAHCAKDLTYRPVHAERFLSQRRFDGFLEKAAAAAPVEDEALKRLWGGRAEPLVEALGAAKFAAWFGAAHFDAGPPVTIRVEKPFAADWIRGHYAGDLKRLFGEVKVEVMV